MMLLNLLGRVSDPSSKLEEGIVEHGSGGDMVN